MTVELSPGAPRVAEILVWVWAATMWLDELRQVYVTTRYLMIFQNGGRLPSWICWGRIWTNTMSTWWSLVLCKKIGWNRRNSGFNISRVRLVKACLCHENWGY